MTLVVGRVTKGQLAIASDTLISDKGKALSLADGTIKSCILPNDLCVSFCNSPELAERAFRDYVANFPMGANFADAVQFFERSSYETNNDYLLAFGHPAKIIKISGGKRRTSLSNTQWIGDGDAFRQFRSYETDQRKQYHHTRAVNGVIFADELKDSPASSLYSTMRNFVQEGGTKSVGGFISIVSFRGIGFRFSVFCDVLFDWPFPIDKDRVLALTDKLQLCVSGDHHHQSIAQIAFRAINLNVVGFYLLKGRLLYIFHGESNGLANKCSLLKNVEPAEITTSIDRFFGQSMNPLVQVFSAASSERHSNVDPDHGLGLAMFCEVNSFPKEPDKFVEVIKGVIPKKH